MNPRGFTVIEVLVVIAVIGILVASVLPTLRDSVSQSEVAKAQSEVVQLRKAVKRLAIDTGAYPKGCGTVETKTSPETQDETTDLSELVAGLTERPTGAGTNCSWADDDTDAWAGPYMEMVPQDPWGNNYIFDPNYPDQSNTSFSVPRGIVVYSKGEDGTKETPDDIVRYIEQTDPSNGTLDTYEHRPD